MPANAIMVDMETMSTRADAVIISIGAVKFDPNSDKMDNEGFYASISISSNLDAGRHISEDTMQWWMKQSDGARAVFSEPKIPLSEALDSFKEWVGVGKYEIWSNGADFDIPMLGHAFSTHGVAPPWEFFRSRCFRTMKSLPFAKLAPVVANPLKHNALQDAITQAKQLQEYYKVLRSLK